LYIEGLVAPLTINTMPESTLKAFADHGKLGPELRGDAGDAEKMLGEFRKAGVDLTALALKLQNDGAASFVASWNNLLGVIASKGSALAQAS
jgi:transaldolase